MHTEYNGYNMKMLFKYDQPGIQNLLSFLCMPPNPLNKQECDAPGIVSRSGGLINPFPKVILRRYFFHMILVLEGIYKM